MLLDGTLYFYTYYQFSLVSHKFIYIQNSTFHKSERKSICFRPYHGGATETIDEIWQGDSLNVEEGYTASRDVNYISVFIFLSFPRDSWRPGIDPGYFLFQLVEYIFGWPAYKQATKKPQMIGQIKPAFLVTSGMTQKNRLPTCKNENGSTNSLSECTS